PGSDQGRGRGSGGSPEMSNLNHYEVILAPVLTGKATRTSEHNQGTFKVQIDGTQPPIMAGVVAPYQVKEQAVNSLRTAGKVKLFRGEPGKRSDWKKAMVTLADGHKIDVTTGI